jgi:hypothetical protein
LWRIHPSYLDRIGLVALWREGLLARAVLRRATRGYRHHPQLDSFKAHPAPVTAINAYLRIVFEEASRRGYSFDESKLAPRRNCRRMPVPRGQLRFEMDHLLRKLKARDRAKYATLLTLASPRPHPAFRVVAGGTAPWERGVKSSGIQ